MKVQLAIVVAVAGIALTACASPTHPASTTPATVTVTATPQAQVADVVVDATPSYVGADPTAIDEARQYRLDNIATEGQAISALLAVTMKDAQALDLAASVADCRSLQPQYVAWLADVNAFEAMYPSQLPSVDAVKAAMLVSLNACRQLPGTGL